MQLFVSLIVHHRVLTISIERIIIASAISLPFIYSATPEITATTSSTIIIKLLNCATNVCHKEVWVSEVPHKVFCLNFCGHFKTSPPLTNGDIGAYWSKTAPILCTILTNKPDMLKFELKANKWILVRPAVVYRYLIYGTEALNHLHYIVVGEFVLLAQKYLKVRDKLRIDLVYRYICALVLRLHKLLNTPACEYVSVASLFRFGYSNKF